MNWTDRSPNDPTGPRVAQDAHRTVQPRLLYLSTLPITLRKMAEGQLRYFRTLGYDVIAVSSPGPHLEALARDEGVPAIAVPMQRDIHPLADLLSLWRLWKLMRRLRPDIVNAGTPKAGLLGMLAARAARVPVRIYLVHGLRLESLGGIKRRVLWLTERIAAACAHRVFCVSRSLAGEFARMRLAAADKLTVLGEGSPNGVRVERFLTTPDLRDRAAYLRSSWGMTAWTPVIGFVGRFVRDKGVIDAYDAFSVVAQQLPETRLLMVGDFEAGDAIPDAWVRRIEGDPRVVRTGFVDDPAPYYLAMDVLVLPTCREGFGVVAIEAGAAGKPVVAYRATGVIDAVRDGVTGTVVPQGDRVALARALLLYLRDPRVRAQHGAANRERARREFRPETIWAALSAHYRELLDLHGAGQPRLTSSTPSAVAVHPAAVEHGRRAVWSTKSTGRGRS